MDTDLLNKIHEAGRKATYIDNNIRPRVNPQAYMEYDRLILSAPQDVLLQLAREIDTTIRESGITPVMPLEESADMLRNEAQKRLKYIQKHNVDLEDFYLNTERYLIPEIDHRSGRLK
jgi:hypothetical protein